MKNNIDKTEVLMITTNHKNEYIKISVKHEGKNIGIFKLVFLRNQMEYRNVLECHWPHVATYILIFTMDFLVLLFFQNQMLEKKLLP